MSHPTETKDTLSWRQQINDMCWRRMRMRRSESQRKWRYCNTRKLKNARWTFKRKIKCWKYLSETFFVFRRMARETPDGVKYNCTTTEKYKKKTAGRKKEEERPFPCRSQDKGKSRERCAIEQPSSHEPLPMLSRFSYALLFACPLQHRCQKSENEREKEGERGHNTMRKEKKTRRRLLLPPFTVHLLLLG